MMIPARTPHPDVRAETDAVIRSFGVRETANELFDIAAEMERRVRIYSGGPVLAGQIVAELRRRAVALRNGHASLRVHG